MDTADNFMIDRPGARDLQAVELFDGGFRAQEIRALAGVAANLCSRDILGAIERRISLLEDVGGDAGS